MFFPPPNRCRFPYIDCRYSQQCDETRSTANLYSPGGCLANEACFAARLTLTFILKDVGDGRLSKVVHTDANAIQQSTDFRRPLPESMIRSRRLNRARKQCFDNTRMMAQQGFHGTFNISCGSMAKVCSKCPTRHYISLPCFLVLPRVLHLLQASY